MKKQIALACLALSAMLFLSGCIAAIGNREPNRGNDTLGKELIDLKTARDVQAITEAEYEIQNPDYSGTNNGF